MWSNRARMIIQSVYRAISTKQAYSFIDLKQSHFECNVFVCAPGNEHRPLLFYFSYYSLARKNPHASIYTYMHAIHTQYPGTKDSLYVDVCMCMRSLYCQLCSFPDKWRRAISKLHYLFVRESGVQLWGSCPNDNRGLVLVVLSIYLLDFPNRHT